MIVRLEDTQKAEVIFNGWKETMIWSCLQKIMGELYVDDPEQPQAAMAVIGDFTFLAGKPNRELVTYKQQNNRNNFTIMVPQNEAWSLLIETCYGEKAVKKIRYAIKKEENGFDPQRLQRFADSLSEEFTLRELDEELFHWCLRQEWSRDFVAQYEDYEQYRKMGLGMMVLKDGAPVAGASSYTSYRDGIEIEIDTLPEFRRRGLATACGASLILKCLERGWYPSWDAANLWSVALAEKLGYYLDHEYECYKIEE